MWGNCEVQFLLVLGDYQANLFGTDATLTKAGGHLTGWRGVHTTWLLVTFRHQKFSQIYAR